MTPESSPSLDEALRQEILLARERVYHFGKATPLEPLDLPSLNAEIWVKREDLSPIKAYKWRGAANRMANLSELDAVRGVVTASAGNHAQGVALAAKQLGIRARIYMPNSTPKIKQNAVLKLGGEYVSIHLSGDSYDESTKAALEDQASTQAVYIHAYDDLEVMAGQGTLADEVVLSGKGPFDLAYVQIGGGGMAAGVSTWLKTYWPDIEIVGVEAEGQASMKASLEKGELVTLEKVDLFCDGTAVKKPGTLPFEICKHSIDRMVTITNAQVTKAIRALWEGLRCISEPSGAMGLAAALSEKETLTGKRVLVILCGANVDFLQIGRIAQSEGSFTRPNRTIRVSIPETPGTMLKLLDGCFAEVDITDFQYGKNHAKDAWPIFTLSTEDPKTLEELSKKLDQGGYTWKDITGATDVDFRAIPFRGDLVSNPAFLRLDFYERQGALHDFLVKQLTGNANLIYFNYRQSGERIGRALIGIDFPSPFERDAFVMSLPPQGDGYRLCEPLDEEASARLASSAET
ncbi:MAG: pyridoxal-phosphate dependent enzyme [Akkermansiaceae bacterium]